MLELLTLYPGDGTSRELLCGLRSITRSEFYQAAATDYRPELVFVLADYYDYNGETLVSYDGQFYRVIKTYRNGHALELTVSKASQEEVERYGGNLISR